MKHVKKPSFVGPRRGRSPAAELDARLNAGRQGAGTELGPASGLTENQEQYLATLLDTGLDGQAAANAVGYQGQIWTRLAAKMERHPRIREAIADWLEQFGVSRHRLLLALAQLVFRPSVAAFEPFLMGKVSLQQLESMGVPTECVQSVSVTFDKDGKVRNRSIQFEKRDSALRQLSAALGLNKPLSQEEEAPAKSGDILDTVMRTVGSAAPSGMAGALPLPPGLAQPPMLGANGTAPSDEELEQEPVDAEAQEGA